MKLISVKLPEKYLEGLDTLVRIGVYPSRSEAIRVAVRDLLKRENNTLPSFVVMFGKKECHQVLNCF